MKWYFIILSCVGALLVTFNKPIGKACNRANLGGYDLWAFRWPAIFAGALLLFWSLCPDCML